MNISFLVNIGSVSNVLMENTYFTTRLKYSTRMCLTLFSIDETRKTRREKVVVNLMQTMINVCFKILSNG